MFKLVWSIEALESFRQLEKNKAKYTQLKAVAKALRYLQNNPRHPSLNTHKYSAIEGNLGEVVFEAYAQNKTPGAYRIFWHYGPGQNEITIVSIVQHP